MSVVNGNVIMSGVGMTTLTMKEEKRLELIQRVFRGELTVVEACRPILCRAGLREEQDPDPLPLPS
jgi:hypothetical protein